MLPRRPLLGLALLPLLGGAARAAPANLAFKVIREGKEVGTHRVTFREEGGLLRARSEVRITVTLAGFTVFRYAHETEEAWQGERLVGLASRLEKNGRQSGCEVRAEGDGLRLRGTAGNFLLPAQAAPLTWWRAANFTPGVPLFDPREGRPVEPRLERRPEAGGQRVTLVGGEGAVIVYDARATWVGFETTGEDGSAIRYARG
ncbi:DUF6134 family protein [Roseomonas sp. AR75]|uniref:DUF6134 family protein n=1 Tax=Roseomonas sp. AR75 TaxID=2562311 RepID=UPI0010C01E07|nr:DUF6134 family protein [Roseomonas sp. AR75]